MSVLRAGYRQLLKKCNALSRIYPDPNDVCFAVFGVLIHRNEFHAGKYGLTPQKILRACFDRPSIPGDPTDTSAARLAACLFFIRQLHDLQVGATTESSSRSAAGLDLHRRRRQLTVTQDENGAVASREVTKTPPSEAMKRHPVSIGSSQGTNSNSNSDDRNHPGSSGSHPGPHRSDAAPSGAAVTGQSITSSSSSSTSSSGAARKETKTSGSGDVLNEGLESSTTLEEVALYNGTFLIQRGNDQRSQKFYRHTVISKDRESFPPYPLLLPPEPVYPRHTQHQFDCLLVHDILHCLSAASYQTYERFVKTQRVTTPANSHPNSRNDKNSNNKPLNAASLPLALTPREATGVRAIPVATLALTDFVEVEVVTRFICTNAAGATGGGTDERATTPAVSSLKLPSSPTAASAANRRRPGFNDVGGHAPHVFAYYLVIRNLDGERNSKGWHIQVLSQHLVVLDVERRTVTEMARPGVGGNFPTLQPGESHAYEAGTAIVGHEGILRGTLQVNAFSEDGQTRAFDVHIAPTRLSTRDSTYAGQRDSDSAAAAPSATTTIQKDGEGSADEVGAAPRPRPPTPHTPTLSHK